MTARELIEKLPPDEMIVIDYYWINHDNPDDANETSLSFDEEYSFAGTKADFEDYDSDYGLGDYEIEFESNDNGYKKYRMYRHYPFEFEPWVFD